MRCADGAGSSQKLNAVHWEEFSSHHTSTKHPPHFHIKFVALDVHLFSFLCCGILHARTCVFRILVWRSLLLPQLSTSPTVEDPPPHLSSPPHNVQQPTTNCFQLFLARRADAIDHRNSYRDIMMIT